MSDLVVAAAYEDYRRGEHRACIRRLSEKHVSDGSLPSSPCRSPGLGISRRGIHASRTSG